GMRSCARRRRASERSDTLNRVRGSSVTGGLAVIGGSEPLSRGRLPDLPGRVAARVHVVEELLLLERVHPEEEAVALGGDELLLRDEALEGFLDELLAGLDRVEDRGPEDEEAGVQPDLGLRDVLDVGDAAVAVRADDVEREAGPGRDEDAGLVL